MAATNPPARQTSLAAIVMGVVAASVALEYVQHLVMQHAGMTPFHIVSAALTLVLVSLAAWQMETRTRWLEASARADDLERANDQLRTAVQELQRADQLAAAGSVVAPLCDHLRAALGEIELLGAERGLIAQINLLLREFETLTARLRKTMRPVDLGGLCEFVAHELVESTGAELSCVRPAEPVWVKANPGRLEVALRHFIAHAAERADAGRPVIVVVDAANQAASVAISVRGPAAPQGEPETLNWRIAHAVVTECGGRVDVTEAADGAVFTLHLAIGPSPG